MEKIQIKPMLYYSTTPLIILLIVIIFLIIVVIKKKSIKNNNYKEEYLLKLNILTNKININKQSKSDYKKLSIIIREYISLTTNTNIKTYSLKEIENLNNKPLTELMTKIYEYEFSNNDNGNIIILINKAKEIINDTKV